VTVRVHGWVGVRSAGANAVNSVPHRVLRRYIYPDSTRGGDQRKTQFSVCDEGEL